MLVAVISVLMTALVPGRKLSWIIVIIIGIIPMKLKRNIKEALSTDHWSIKHKFNKRSFQFILSQIIANVGILVIPRAYSRAWRQGCGVFRKGQNKAEKGQKC